MQAISPTEVTYATAIWMDWMCTHTVQEAYNILQ